MGLNDNFICDNCKRKLNWWDKFKLSLGVKQVKKYECKCGNITYFKENVFLKYLPIPFAAAIILIPRTLPMIIGWAVLVIGLLYLYFINLKRNETK